MMLNLVSKLSSCRDKSDLLEYHDMFVKYLKSIGAKEEDTILTLNALLQGNLKVDKIVELTYQDCLDYLVEMVNNHVDLTDICFVMFGLIKIAKSNEEGTCVSYLKFREELNNEEQQ